MAKTSFAINEEPHVDELGDDLKLRGCSPDGPSRDGMFCADTRRSPTVRRHGGAVARTAPAAQTVSKSPAR
ncbi:hypothetical protein, partial [Streptomyces sp. ADI96-02]|uniref:hypothetical protein n=1 Tax=Streptomyces sp. ADI96-02 TaxID=1522760 RepID=UPI0019D1EB04